MYEWFAQNYHLSLKYSADDYIIIIVSHPKIHSSQNCMNDTFATLNEWIKAGELTLNFDNA
jgi:hypothetical protein